MKALHGKRITPIVNVIDVLLYKFLSCFLGRNLPQKDTSKKMVVILASSCWTDIRRLLWAGCVYGDRKWWHNVHLLSVILWVS